MVSITFLAHSVCRCFLNLNWSGLTNAIFFISALSAHFRLSFFDQRFLAHMPNLYPFLLSSSLL